MRKEELDDILMKHRHWYNHTCEGWENMCADLRGADLSGVDLSNAFLVGANVSDANLRDAKLDGAYLSGANLSYTDFTGASLNGTDLSYADLRDAMLRNAILDHAALFKALLSSADFSAANLTYADLRRADLSGAYFKNADLKGVKLNDAYITNAHFSGSKNMPYIPYACPEEGSFIGYKKVSGCYIVKLEIPADAKRSSATTRKCRCNKAKVLEIQFIDGTKAYIDQVSSIRDKNFIYKVGEIVSVPDFDENRWLECSTGIHFFLNRLEAVHYWI